MISWNTGQKKKGMVKKMIYEIVKKSTDFKNIEFCFKALSKDKKDQRKHLHHFKVQEGFVVATDGRRLHKIKPVIEIEDGLYRPFKAEPGFVLVKVEDFDYPESDDLFVSANFDKSFELSTIDLDHSLATIIRKISTEWCVNHSFIKDLLDDHYEVEIYNEGGKLLFKKSDESKKAVVMMKKC